jgi:hypothetical protein
LCPSFEAPFRKSPRSLLQVCIGAKVLEQPAANDLADFRLIVGNQVFRNPTDDLTAITGTTATGHSSVQRASLGSLAILLPIRRASFI